MPFAMMNPKDVLNKAYWSERIPRTAFDSLAADLWSLLQSINPLESEEHHKLLLVEFIKKAIFPNNFVNTSGRIDLVVHNGKPAKSSIGVLMEVKSPANRAEFPRENNLECKALYELVLYYLRERITEKNGEIRNVVITNLTEWYIIDAHDFESCFMKNKELVRQFEAFEAGQCPDTSTEFFYNEIAAPACSGLVKTLSYIYVNAADCFQAKGKPNNALIAFSKIISTTHLLKAPFANKALYDELRQIELVNGDLVNSAPNATQDSRVDTIAYQLYGVTDSQIIEVEAYLEGVLQREPES
jgi:adenine-specific DNA-methyltransferase